MSIRIIACGVFRDALRQIEPQGFNPGITITYITPYLHNHPQKLQEEILHQIHLAQRAGDEIFCLYEILLGSKRFHAIIAEEAGTYFLEKDLILNFAEYCRQPLELDDPLMRESYFQHYTQLAYIRQPLDPDTVMPHVSNISQFLKLKPLVIDADYGELTANLLRLFTLKD